MNKDVVKKLGEMALDSLVEKSKKNGLAKKLLAYLDEFQKQQINVL